MTLADALTLLLLFGGFGATVWTVATQVQQVINKLEDMNQGLGELEQKVKEHDGRLYALERGTR